MKLRFANTLIVPLTLLALTFSVVGVTPARAANSNAGTAEELIAAINAANLSAEDDVITLTANITLTEAYSGSSNGLPIIGNNGKLTIEGNGFKISRNTSAGDFRVLEIENGTDLTLNSVTIENGNCSACNGGGIETGGSNMLTIANSVFSGNSSNYGGAINLYESTLTLTNTTLSNNSATYDGGGIYASGSALTIAGSSSFNGNSARSGGGMYSQYDNSNASLTNVTFNNNNSATDGGGMYNNASGIPTLTDVSFNDNSASGDGGGMYNYRSSPSLTNATFSANSANSGGGMVNLESDATLTNATFSDNFATYGAGGMYNYQGSAALTNATFSGNSAYAGGGMLNFESNVTLTNATFSDNSVAYDGGGIYNDASSPILTNATFSGNSASRDGGGVYNVSASNPTLANVTFSGNSASRGGGMFNGSSSPTLVNTIIANSASGGDCVNISSTLNVASANNLVEDAANACGLTNGIDGNIVGFDPSLDATLNDNSGSTQTHALLIGSKAINAGANCAATDQRGVTRPQGRGCDIGAYEVASTQSAPNFVVNSAADTDDGICDLAGQGFGNQDCTLREALLDANAISGADTITFDSSLNGAPITLVGSQLPAVTTEIIINGNGAANTIVQANAAPNTATYRVFEVSSAGNLTLNGLTARNGRCDGSCATVPYSGGGIYSAGTLTISNAAISNNSAVNSLGGGIFNFQGSAMLTNVTISENSAEGSGGGAGGMVNFQGSAILTNVTISKNSAGGGAGGMLNQMSELTLTNVTFSGNFAPDGGGMYNGSSSNATLINTIIANSTSGGDCVNDSSTVNAQNSLIEDGLTCVNGTNINNLTGDPKLDETLSDNGGSTQTHALLIGSAAIDAGANTGCSATDQRGVTRPQGATCDIGAYELRKGAVTFKSTGAYDGWILESSETSNAGGTLNRDSASFVLGDGAADKQYRAILSFNTSGLPDNAVVTSATLKIKRLATNYLTGNQNPFSWGLGLRADVCKNRFGAALGLQLDDFNYVNAANCKIPAGTFVSTPIANWYRVNLLSGSWSRINKGGWTQFRLRFAKDDNDDGLADYIKFYSGNAGAINRPQLIIQYYAP